MKKFVSCLLALTLFMSLALTASADIARTVEPFEGEAPTITWGFNASSRYEPESLTWPSGIFEAVRKSMNVDLQFVNNGDAQQVQVMLAGGDLPDITAVDKLHLSQVLQAGLMVAMDDYLEYAPNLVSLSPIREAVMREYNSMGDGKWYFWTPQVGPAVKDPRQWNGYTTRWDYYKEMGTPEITGMDGYIDYIQAAVEAYPQTADGKKVWGYGLWNDLWAYYIPGSVYNGGYTNITEQYHLNYVDSSVVNAFVDDNGPIWPSIEFCFKLNQLGLFDPDSFTMTGDDYRAKVADEQYISIACQWYDSLYDVKKLEDPDTLAGYVVLPVEGNALWSGSIEYVGWNFYYGITTSCADPIIAMRLFDFFNSPEGARLMFSGEQGSMWDYDENGNPSILPDVVEKRNTMTNDEWDLFGGNIWDGAIGIAAGTVLEDGGIARLFYSRDMLKQTLRGLDKDFAAFYGVELPHDVSDTMVAEGKATDQSVYMRALVGLLGTPPTEITRVDNNVTEIFKRTLPDLVLAADQAAFDAVKADLLKELYDSGIQESMDWWFDQADQGRAFIEANS